MLALCTKATFIKPANFSMHLRYLTPPLLTDIHIQKRVLCHRPSRSALPRAEVAKSGNQIIGYNYGFGGAGWTLAPGATYSLVNQFSQAGINPSHDIVIIGAGISGLMTAYELLKRGYNNISIIAEQTDSLATHNAGGLIMPSPVIATPNGRSILEYFLHSHRWYSAILQNKHEDFNRGVHYVSAYFAQPQRSYDALNGIVMQPAQKIVIDFGTGKRHDAVVYDNALFVDVHILLDQLWKFIVQHGVHIAQRSVATLQDIDSSVIIVAAGLGAKYLAHDNAVRSIQGHQLLLKDQNTQIANYTLSFEGKTGKAASGHDIKRSIYFHPKRLPNALESAIGVIGATYVQGAYTNTPNEEEYDLMLQRARDFFGT